MWTNADLHYNHEEYKVYPKKYAHGFCFAVLCYGYTLTDFPISIRLTSLALWQSNECRSASKATLMNMDKYFMWIHYERLHNHKKAKHNKTVCIFLGLYCIWQDSSQVCILVASMENWIFWMTTIFESGPKEQKCLTTRLRKISKQRDLSLGFYVVQSLWIWLSNIRGIRPF